MGSRLLRGSTIALLSLAAACGADTTTTDASAIDGDDPGGDSAGESPADVCPSSLTFEAEPRAHFEADSLLTTVALANGEYLALIREAEGEFTMLCPDCNDETFDWCGDCSQSVLSVVDADGDLRIELDRWWRGGAGHHIASASAAIDSEGRLAVAWRRRLSSSGSSAQGVYARVDLSTGDIDGPTVVYDKAGGDLRVFPSPDADRVLLLRDYTVVLARIGVHTRVLAGDGSPLTDWQQTGSSLGYKAGAASLEDGQFAVAFSDQAADQFDPDCVPCDSFETCFGGEGGGFEGGLGCHNWLDATAAGGLQLFVVDEGGAGPPVQMRSGWYDRIYQGEEQTLYADHGEVVMRRTAGGLAVLTDYRVETFWIEVGLQDGSVTERKLPIDHVETHTSPWAYALADIGGTPTALMVSYLGGEEQQTSLHAYWLEGDCFTQSTLGAWPDSNAGFVPTPGGEPRLEVRWWNENGSAAASADVYEVVPAGL